MVDSKQTIYIEIRPAAGGDEAKIWASDMLRMYVRFATNQGWKVEPIDEGTIKIAGEGAYSSLKHETGVHRVQRVPATEKRGRTHTSTATVVVIPQIQQHAVQIAPYDLDWQFYRASSQGGQNVQKVSTAVRLIHKPSGIVVTAQQERSQEQNRQAALELLRAKLYQKRQEEAQEKVQGFRAAAGTGDRSEKIRTYNFPQSRVTDHRINKSWGNLEQVVDGRLEKVVEVTKSLN